MTSHWVRQPITSIIGLSNMLEEFKNSPNETMDFQGYMKQSTIALDVFTNELITLMCELEHKSIKKKRPDHNYCNLTSKATVKILNFFVSSLNYFLNLKNILVTKK
jgi:hypothetical protein